MNTSSQRTSASEASPELHSELLILPDGRILVHNLTQTMAALLRELNPNEVTINSRVEVRPEPQTTVSQTVA